MDNRPAHIIAGLAAALAALAFHVAVARADLSAIAGLEASLKSVVERTESTVAAQNSLLRQSAELTGRIDKLKRELRDSATPIKSRRLQTDLRAAQSLAEQIAALDVQLADLSRESLRTKRAIIDELGEEIARLSAAAESSDDPADKARWIEQGLHLQTTRERYLDETARQSRNLLLTVEVTLTETDGPDDIRAKTDIVRDQQDTIRERIGELSAETIATEERLELLQGMWELLREMRRGEDDEFDLDRSLRMTELEDEMANLREAVLVLRARSERWRERIAGLEDKAAEFDRELQRTIGPQRIGRNP